MALIMFNVFYSFVTKINFTFPDFVRISSFYQTITNYLVKFAFISFPMTIGRNKIKCTKTWGRDVLAPFCKIISRAISGTLLVQVSNLPSGPHCQSTVGYRLHQGLSPHGHGSTVGLNIYLHFIF